MDERDDVAGLSPRMAELLASRAARTEREVQGLRRMNLLLGIGVVACLALSLAALASAGFFAGGERTVEASRFVLDDERGVPRATWEVAEEGGAQFHLRDHNGVSRIKLSVLESGDPGIALTDGRGRTRIVLGLLPDQGGSLVFADEAGDTRVVLGVAPDESSTLVFVDGDGLTRAGLGVDGQGDPSLTLYERAPGAAVPDTTRG